VGPSRRCGDTYWGHGERDAPLMWHSALNPQRPDPTRALGTGRSVTIERSIGRVQRINRPSRITST